MRLNFKYFVIPILLFAIALEFSACGKKAAPRAPEVTAPREVRFFTAAGKTNGILLSWQVPEGTAEGGPLKDLKSFVVRRNVLLKKESSGFDTIARVPFTGESAELSVDQLNQKTAVNYLDEDVLPGARYEYQITPVNDRNVKGRVSRTLRVRFSGESSTVEVL